MNQKYIDFVPSKKAPTPTSARSAARPSAPAARPAKASQPTVRRSPRPQPAAQRTAPAARPAAPAHADTFSIKKEPAYGVIEDFHPKFVKTEVEKRPLSRSHFAATSSELSELKSQNIKKSSRQAPAEPPADTTGDKKSLPIPKSPFIAKAKVAKRPLSKNVYTKPVQPTKEPATPQPVTIISKPESGGKAGMAIAIILTIILGAVAGTIAFLILPK